MDDSSARSKKYPLLRPIGDSLEGKVVLVTGANRGIGKAFVETFLERGASKVYAACRSVASAEAAFGDRTNAETGAVVPLRLDMSDPDRISEIATIAADVDIVVNNAGVLTRTTPLEGEIAVDHLKLEMDVNVYGLLRLANAFAPLLSRRAGKGILVQVNSVASMRCAVPDASTYSASKAAAFSVTQALREQLGAMGVHVVSVHPGPIATDMIADLPDLAAIAPPASIVSESLVDAITSPSGGLPPLLVYPDPKAEAMGRAFRSFAELVIEEGKAYGEE